ncbi:MAG: hypothetical protein O7G85_06050, partial [Planctomycetota bacterium]|nr:hypothetical protein [Planctomycetota bacterium]
LTHADLDFDQTGAVFDDSTPALEFRIATGVYLPRLTGTTTLGPMASARDLDFKDDLDLNGSESILNIEVTLIKDELWELQISGFDFDTSTHGTFDSTSGFGNLTLMPGDEYRAEFDMSSYGIELARRQWKFYEDDKTVDLTFLPTLGARAYNIRQMVDQVGVGREVIEEDYLNLYLGLKLDLEWQARETISWLERLQIEAGFFIGPVLGADNGFGWSVRATLNFYFNEHMSLLFGYRLYELNIEDDEFELDGGLQGLFIGGVYRF